MSDFVNELKELLNKYDLHLSGTIRMVDMKDEKWDRPTASVGIHETLTYGPITDRTGPFLVASIEEKPLHAVECNSGLGFQVSPDIQGYDCPVTGKWIDGRRDHRENLKRHNCRIKEKGDKEWAEKRRKENLTQSIENLSHKMAEKIAQNI